MIRIKGQLNKKEKAELSITLQEMTDIYGDFYITKNNLRLAVKENTDLLYNNLKNGDKIVIGETEGIAIVTGFSDNAPRKYVKILATSNEGANKLIKVLLQNVKCDLFAKIKKNNPIKEVLQNNNFKFVGDRGKEILLGRKQLFKR